MDNLKKVDDLIKRAGGAIHLAAYLGLAQAFTVERWRSSGVPRKHWEMLIERYGCTAEELHNISERAREKA